MCNRLPEINKNGDAGIFPVYYSLKSGLIDTVQRICSFLLLLNNILTERELIGAADGGCPTNTLMIHVEKVVVR